jgi:deoxyhypusine synthase
MLEPEVTVGLSITGALTPAGLGISALIPLIKAGFIDWIISTGANLYHDTHFGIGLAMHLGNATTSDIVLREEEVVRIYDIFFDYSVLLDTDAFFRKIIEGPEFNDRCRLPSFTTFAVVTSTNVSRSWVLRRSRCSPSLTSMQFQFTRHPQATLPSE